MKSPQIQTLTTVTFLLTTEHYSNFGDKMQQQKFSQWLILPEAGEDITGASAVLPAIQSSTKLPNRLQEVDVVTANKVLRQVDDR